MDERALVFFYELGATLRHVLCIRSSPRNIQALYMLAKAGVKVTCLACHRNRAELQAYGLTTIRADLAEWLMTTGQTTLADYDGLLFDPQIEAYSIQLLKGCLWPQTRILVNGITPDDHPLKLAWGPPQRTLNGLEIYDEPPSDWLDLAKSNRSFYLQDDWPWKPREVELPPSLPSGRPWPKISIVTVTLNQGNYLEETIRSVLLQGYPNLEYIVIDGGSTDNTPVILERYGAELTHCVSEPDHGQADALNKGFRLATGDILAWLNSDDRYLPGTLLRVALAFDTYGDADIVAGGCALFHGDEQIPFRTHHNAMPVGRVIPLPLSKLLDIDGSWQRGDFFYQPEVFWSRDIWERSGARVDQNLFYSMDYELWLRMAQQEARIVHILDTLALYRVHDEQKTSGDDLPFLPELRRVNKAFRKSLRNS
jgi:GT2 family glycosyltransferase